MIDKFREYLQSFGIDKKLEQEIFEEALLKKHYFYLHLADFLSPLFPSIPEKKIEELAFSGYLYFRFLINLDGFLDSSDAKSKVTFFSSFRIFEYSLQSLAYLFPKQSPFWREFDGHKNQYISSVLFEKELSKSSSAITLEHFLTLAIGKSAVCYAMVSALNNLGEPPKDNESVVECLKQIHIAFQYLDDLDDFKKDHKEGQRTLAHELVKQSISQNGYDFGKDIEQKYKYLFVSGIASGIIDDAIKHYTNGKRIAEDLHLKKLENFIETQIEQCISRRKEIEQLLDKTRKKASKSVTYNKTEVLDIKKAVEEAIGLSNSFLLGNLNENGLWSDFLTTAGEGQTWISAYTGMMMAEIGLNIPFLENLLRKNKLNGAYNETIVQDCDSTNFLVGFKSLVEKKKDFDLIADWYSFMKPNGGWVTYRHENLLRERLNLTDRDDVSGWMSEHICVTSAAAYVLYKTQIDPVRLNKTCEFLAEHIEKDNYWVPYWWTSPVYSTAFAVMALSGDKSFYDIAKKACDRLVKNQGKDGSWINPPYKVPSAFYTALALKALISFSADEYKNNIELGIKWLIENQTSDGSWITNRILCIPSPETKKAEDVQHWRNSSFGTNIIVDDHNRIFTTATALNVLSIFFKN